MTDVHVVIPARLASTRLPRKTLLMLGDKPVVQHVWERAQGIGATSVTVATDSDEIAAACRGFGADCEMTATTHASGTDRIAEVAARRGWADDIIVNVQGDEPFMPAAAIRQVAGLMEDPTTDMATLSVPLADHQLMDDPNCVKVVSDAHGRALYFSRAPIPFARNDAGFTPQRHIGLYAYRASVLRALVAAGPCPLELTESLEQLRALYLGYVLRVAEAEAAPPPGIDTPEDMERARSALAEGVLNSLNK